MPLLRARPLLRRWLSCTVLWALFSIYVSLSIFAEFYHTDFLYESKKDVVRWNGIDAVVTIASKDYSALRFVSSLRLVGEFNGPVFVFSDNMSTSHHKLEGYNVTLVDISRHEPTFDTAEAEKSWKHSYIAKAKWYKTQMFHLLSGNGTSKINSILYVDADEIVNSPIFRFEIAVSSCIKKSKPTKEKKCSAFFFPERIYVSYPFNSGTGLYFRNASASFMHEWSKEILSGKYGRDQSAFVAAMERTNLRVCPLPSLHNYYSMDVITAILNFLTFGYRRKWASFIHPTSAKDKSQMATVFDGSKVVYY